MNCFSCAATLPKRVGVPNATPSAPADLGARLLGPVGDRLGERVDVARGAVVDDGDSSVHDAFLLLARRTAGQVAPPTRACAVASAVR